MEGTIFDIREFTVHDGPGVRVTVFLKGCPLRCRWCHNPEGLSPKPELMIRTGACTGCNSCKKPCLHPECKPFDRCLHACPDGLISLCGEKISSDMLSQKLLSCAPFLKNGGGVTFSGGEPLMQHDFLYETLTKVKPLHRAVETSGFADPDIFRKILNECELIMIDLKLANREEHKKYTGVYNDVILKNIRILQESRREHIIRIPLIPGITDTEKNLRAAAQIAGGSHVQLLRYNKAAGAKYPAVGRVFRLEEKPAQHVDISIFEKAELL